MTFSSSYKLIFIFSCFLTLSCKQGADEIIEGDLYFSWLRIGSFYNQPDSIVQKVKTYADTVDKKNVSAEDNKFFTMYETLKKENLLYSPFIELKLDNDSIVKTYLSVKDYEKIRKFHRSDLIEAGMIVRIKAEIKNMGNGLVLCEKLISIDKVKGETHQRSRKLKIEDYQ